MPGMDRRDQRCDAVTRYRECICLQDCRNEERDLTKLENLPAAFYCLSSASLTASRTI